MDDDKVRTFRAGDAFSDKNAADVSYLLPEGMRAKRPDWWVDGLLPQERECLRNAPRLTGKLTGKLAPGDAWKMVHLLDTLLEDRLQGVADGLAAEVQRG